MNCANHLDRERVSFCQNCGKPLCTECSRTVGAGVFCEPCLAARLAGAGSASSYTSDPIYGATVVPPVPGAPNPALAGLLGLIPGVGAMYNEQYAKGVVHLVVFAVLVSLAADVNGVFGLLITGWVFYQVFEAYHTARARRDGTPLPNPFGLNDIGERFGFGKAWPTAAPVPPVAPPATPFTDGAQAVPPQNAVPPTNWGAPAYTYTYPESSAPPYTPPVPPFSAPYEPPYTATSYAAAPYEVPRKRFPAGAIWLIALGLIFFFSSSGIFQSFPVHRIIPFLLIGFGVWLFIHKMTGSGQTFGDDGSPEYRLRIFRALRGSIWVVLVGVLFFLDSFNILSWGHSWPLFIIVAGLMSLLERAAYNTASTSIPYSAPMPGAAAAPQAAQATASTSIVPRHDEEGR